MAVAEERLALAVDRLNGLRTGLFSPEVQAARLGVQQAEVGVAQVDAQIAQAEAAESVAEQAVAEAEAALAAIDAQLEKLTVHAAVSGVVLARGIEPGEVLAPGLAAITLGLLEDLTITVYLPEDRYGQVALGDAASVSADSFPDRVFNATVIRIADQAEFTPRNVQTQEERVTTVYAIELSVDGDGLKPGMPADVVFAVP